MLVVMQLVCEYFCTARLAVGWNSPVVFPQKDLGTAVYSSASICVLAMDSEIGAGQADKMSIVS